jgi:LPS-assembly lipoprotein
MHPAWFTRMAGSALLAWLALAAGCGFQLQGQQVMPPALTQLQLDPADRQSDFTRALRASLSAAGATLLEDSAATVSRVHIVTDEFTERVLSVDARNIPTDYELTYRVEIEVRAPEREILPREEFELARIYSFDETKLLAKEREKEILREALAKDLASVVTRRLSTLQ